MTDDDDSRSAPKTESKGTIKVKMLQKRVRSFMHEKILVKRKHDDSSSTSNEELSVTKKYYVKQKSKIRVHKSKLKIKKSRRSTLGREEKTSLESLTRTRSGSLTKISTKLEHEKSNDLLKVFIKVAVEQADLSKTETTVKNESGGEDSKSNEVEPKTMTKSESDENKALNEAKSGSLENVVLKLTVRHEDFSNPENDQKNSNSNESDSKTTSLPEMAKFDDVGKDTLGEVAKVKSEDKLENGKVQQTGSKANKKDSKIKKKNSKNPSKEKINKKKNTESKLAKSNEKVRKKSQTRCKSSDVGKNKSKDLKETNLNSKTGQIGRVKSSELKRKSSSNFKETKSFPLIRAKSGEVNKLDKKKSSQLLKTKSVERKRSSEIGRKKSNSLFFNFDIEKKSKQSETKGLTNNVRTSAVTNENGPIDSSSSAKTDDQEAVPRTKSEDTKPKDSLFSSTAVTPNENSIAKDNEKSTDQFHSTTNDNSGKDCVVAKSDENLFKFDNDNNVLVKRKTTEQVNKNVDDLKELTKLNSNLCSETATTQNDYLWIIYVAIMLALVYIVISYSS